MLMTVSPIWWKASLNNPNDTVGACLSALRMDLCSKHPTPCKYYLYSIPRFNPTRLVTCSHCQSKVAVVPPSLCGQCLSSAAWNAAFGKCAISNGTSRCSPLATDPQRGFLWRQPYVASLSVLVLFLVSRLAFATAQPRLRTSSYRTHHLLYTSVAYKPCELQLH